MSLFATDLKYLNLSSLVSMHQHQHLSCINIINVTKHWYSLCLIDITATMGPQKSQLNTLTMNRENF